MNDTTLIVIALTIGIGGLAPAIAIKNIASQGLDAIGKNPEASDKITTGMIMAIAFAEAIAIYCLVISLVMKFT